MKAQIEKELKELAIEILSIQNRNTHILKMKTAQIYERLCFLAYTEKLNIEIATLTEVPENTDQVEFNSINEAADFVATLSEDVSTTDSFSPTFNPTERRPRTSEADIPSETKSISEIIPEIVPEIVPEIKNTPVSKPVIETPEPPNTDVTKPIDPIQKNTTVSEAIHFEKKRDALQQQEVDLPNITNTHAPELLHELEALTAGFDLPEFDPIQSTQTSQPVSPNQSTQPNKPTQPQTAISNTYNAPIPEPVSNSEDSRPSKLNDTAASQQKSSVNDRLKKSIQIGLNDRLGFIKHLFNGNQDDYTRVLSQLNTFQTNTEAIDFIEHMVKPEYNNWENKEAYETRFLEVVFRKFDSL